MKFQKCFFQFVFVLLYFQVQAQSVSINTTGASPDGSAMLDIQANDKGVLIPRLDSLQRVSISSPAEGLLVYDQTSRSFWFYSNTMWKELISDATLPFKRIWGSGITGDVYRSGGVALGAYLSSSGYGLNVQNYTNARGAIRGAEDFGGYLYSEGRLGVLNIGNALNLPFHVANIGVLGIKPNAPGDFGTGVYGWNNDDNFENYGGVFVSDGTHENVNMGIYSSAQNGDANYAGYFQGRLHVQGNALTADANESVIKAIVGNNNNYNTIAVQGKSIPLVGKGYGVYGEGGSTGIFGYANAGASTGYAYGVYGYAGATGSSGTRIGVYGTAFGGATNWAGYFGNGNVYVAKELRIGTLVGATGYTMAVNGKIACEEVLVQYDNLWPDYVFDEDYSLMPLRKLDEFLQKEKHLPGIPSAAEIAEKGISIGEMQASVIEKLEEITLYLIELEKEIEILKNENESLQRKIEKGNH